MGGLACVQHGPGRTGKADREFLEKCFHKLLINFAWWVNKVDSAGNNVFEGGFLGLDNITVIDRSDKLPGGAVLEQSDATGWMGMFCLNLMRIALELAQTNKVYEALALKFFEHYIYIGAAMKHMGGRELLTLGRGRWLLLRRASLSRWEVRQVPRQIPGRNHSALRRRGTATPTQYEGLDEFRTNFLWFVNNRSKLTNACCHSVESNGEQLYALTVVDRESAASHARTDAWILRVPLRLRHPQSVQIPRAASVRVRNRRSSI